MVAGDLKSIVPGSGRVAIGARLAETLGAFPGSEISLISPDGRSTPVGTVPRIVTYTVGAIFEVGIFEYDKAFVIMPMQDAQTLLLLGDGVGMVEVQVDDPDKVARNARAASAAGAGQGHHRRLAADESALFEALEVERIAMFVVLCIIILVAAFNIASSLIMLVRAKTRDIAILRTMGASRRSMLKIFMTVGLSIGLIGIVIGCDPRRRLPLLPAGGRELDPAGDRPESVGSVGPLPDRAAVADRSVRSGGDRRDDAGADLFRYIVPGAERRQHRSGPGAPL